MSTLVINSSVQQQASVSRQLVSYLTRQLAEHNQLGAVVERDLADNDMQFISASHVGAFYTEPEQRNDEQREVIALSDTLVAELKQSKQLIIGAPMYNFTVPGVLKAWVDLICRVGETFQYTQSGAKGLLDIDKAYFVISAGGPMLGSDMDFSSGYLQQVGRFIGVKESYIIAAGGTKSGVDAVLESGKHQIDQLISQ